MARHNCELFGHISYSAELTYNELYALEADLIDELQNALQGHSALHIDTVGTGDALRVQCVFAEYDEGQFHALCDDVAEAIPANVRARFLFVDKSLTVIHLYCFTNKGWKESALDISAEACAAATGR